MSKIQNDSLQRIGWIGAGVMGASMAGHLRAAGHELYVYNRTRAKADTLIAAGAHWCDSPAEVAARVETLFTIVGYPDDVSAVYLGEDGVFAGAARKRNGANAGVAALKTVIDMTTSSPDLAREIAARATELNIAALDAPVSGGDVGAREARLAIMVGGDASAFAGSKPLFEILGANISHMGPAGAGQATKLANQILVAGNMIGACEALLYARRAGLDPGAVIDVIGKGAAGSWTINNLGPRIVAEDYAPGFFIEHFIKDMGLALQECERMRLELPGLQLVRDLYEALAKHGHARSGTQALYLGLAAMNGL
ncbi:MAG: NAD(P)-dependent oxidoreductase [bacterium]|nr:NAD(P)-dependent oxidoreductase [bacterium]